MAGPLLFDRIRETTTTTGTGTITLAGAVAGYQSFSVVGNGNTCPYCIVDQSGANWEVGIGTWNTGGTITRTAGNALAAEPAPGTRGNSAGRPKDRFLTYPASRAVLKAAALTQGSIPFANANGDLTQNNAKLFWDATNNRFGLGTNAPGSALDGQATLTSGTAFSLTSTQTT